MIIYSVSVYRTIGPAWIVIRLISVKLITYYICCDRSTWTDTPEEKARKAAGLKKEEDLDSQLKEESRMRHIVKRDEEQESAVK